jgi:hypothetical protein
MNETPRCVETILIVLCVVLVGLHFSLALRPHNVLPSQPFDDDSFYAFTIADNIAKGDGVTIDGHVRTNGFQPLIVFIYALVFRLFGGGLFRQLRLVHIVSASLAALSAVLLYRFCRTSLHGAGSGRRGSLLAALVWLGTCPTFIYKMKGLETGLYFVAILACLSYYQNLRSRLEYSTKRIITFGAVLGFTVLTRIDAVFLVGAFCLAHIWRHRSHHLQAAKETAIFGGTAIAVSSPWWVYNVMLFGSPMPTSGYAQGVHSGTLAYSVSRNLAGLLPALSSLLYPVTYLPNRTLLDRYFPGAAVGFSVAVTVVASAAILILVLKKGQGRRLLQSTLVRDLAPLIGHGGLLFVYYTFFFAAAHYMVRYLAPILLVTVPLNAVIISSVLDKLRIGKRSLPTAGTAAVGVLLTVGLVLFIAYHFTAEDNPFYRDQWGWVADNPGAKQVIIGAGQTGTLGYFWRPVVNLDGKVNHEALRALQSGTIDEYIIGRGIEYLIDWPVYLEMNLLQYPQTRDRFVEIARRGEFGVFKRRDSPIGSP